MAVHPTAIVEDGAVLGAGVEIGPFSIVGKDVRLGDGVRLLSHVVIGGITTIGARTVVHPHAVLGGESQIRGHNPAGTELSIGEDCIIREAVTISLGSPKSHNITRVGSRNYLMAYSHIGHDCIVGNDCTFANGAQLGGHVTIGDSVVLGGLCTVQQFGRIGRGAMLGGMAGANLDVIPFGIAFGSHAFHAGLNIVGLKRRGVSRPAIHALRHTYKAVLVSDEGTLAERVAFARQEWGSHPEVAEVLDFIAAPAKRKIAPARRHGEDADEA
ncbi:UDP-N-acetylglucosamine acyltransferase [Rhizomicrobium palustre]|uniref:UDP-N-acetylglucosamine acyltransferase n=1 Tax=Rhizomicrobium palustre TaxID=189966 RepID=A0A846N1I3_9PROT|nr:acyl-ACP--UDP-N-acetylglucosamine O-acyltransferase [Rhizomicrobium palustre]NIK89596.1 UDP-N-acetylglucosamine acyltransferase [Rhizomicrobium palustre]